MSAPADPNALTLPQLWEAFERTGQPRRLLELARDEDLGPRHAATTATAAGRGTWTGRVAARADGVAAGLACVPLLIELFPGEIEFDAVVKDGQPVRTGDTLGTLRGERAAALILERTLLNIVGRLSGVATRTAAFVRAIADAGADAELWDTRKTTPGLRLLEKYAVRCGGGMNHRLGLHDAVMIKDNFLEGDDADTGRRVAGMLDAIDAAVRTGEPAPRFTEVEVDRLSQLESLLEVCGDRIDAVLLDNMDTEALREAVRTRNGIARRVALEASGGVSLNTVGPIASTGVDRVSAGSLTHGAVSLDVGLDAGLDTGDAD